MRRHLAWLLVVSAPLCSCELAALGSYEHLPGLRSSLEPYGIEPAAAPTKVAQLQWRTPTDCLQVYSLDVEYEPDIMFEPDSVSTLVLGPPRKPRNDNPTAGATLSPGEVFTGQAYFLGVRAETKGVFRDWYLSAEHAGPAAPTAACWPQTWDPIEDALALGWPKLPGRLVAVDETWDGLRVESKCNRGACIDPKTGGGGPDTHHLSCVTPSWNNELAGIYEVQGQTLALVSSRWSDGQVDDTGRNIGLWSEREVLVSIEHGRPVWARFVLHHTYAQPTATKEYAPIVRTWTLESIDECPGSLSSLGWQRRAQSRSSHDDVVKRFEKGDDRVRRNTDDEPRTPRASPPSAPAN